MINMNRNNIVENLIQLQNNRFLYPIAHVLLAFLGVEVPKEVIIGQNVRFVHRAPGTVIHPSVRIGDNVQIYQGVTLGVAIPWNDEFARSHKENGGGRINVGNDVILCAGCKVLAKETLIVGRGTIVAANAVLLCSTGENEIWAGIPAKCVGKRKK